MMLFPSIPKLYMQSMNVADKAVKQTLVVVEVYASRCHWLVGFGGRLFLFAILKHSSPDFLMKILWRKLLFTRSYG